MKDLVVLDPKKKISRILLIAAVVFAITLAWFGISWQIGDMLADVTPPADPNASSVAVLAERLAPSDPLASWLRASAGKDAISESPGFAIEQYERTVQLAPYDYRWRVDLGRAFEEDGNVDRAETEIKRAVDLAPSYAYPRWHLGNFYLRQNRIDEGFAQLKQATENNADYREQVFALAWDYFDRDPAQVEKLAGDLPETRAGLALFFAARGRAADSLRNWNLLSDSNKSLNGSIGRAIALGLFTQRHFAEALQFSKLNGTDIGANPRMVTNGGFESPIKETEDSWFGWQITRNDPKIEISPDPKIKHQGERSLRVAFRSYNKPELTNIAQIIVVTPKTRYHLHFYVRTENLRSVGGPILDVVNANDGKSIVQSKPFPTGTNDWQEMAVEFITPENCDGIQIRTMRSYCGESCSITGTLWYDDFEIVGP